MHHPRAIYVGHVSVRLPFPPGVEYDYMEDPPEGTVPMKWDKSYKVTNEDLRNAELVLKDEVIGAETVAVAKDGRLGLVDKYGKVRLSTVSNGSYTAIGLGSMPCLCS